MSETEAPSPIRVMVVDDHPLWRDAVERDGKIGYSEFASDPCRSLYKRVQSAFSPSLSDNCNVNVGRLGERAGERHLRRELPVDLLAPGEQPPDLPGEQAAAGVVLEGQLAAGHAEHGGRRLLLGPADSWDGGSRNLRIEPTRVPVTEHAVRDSGASTGPAGDRPTRPEIDVIGVSNYNQRTFDLVVSKNHTYPRQPTLMATRPKNPTLL